MIKGRESDLTVYQPLKEMSMGDDFATGPYPFFIFLLTDWSDKEIIPRFT